MSKWDKLLERILRGKSDANIPFNDLCGLLELLGFEKRTRGSHNVFRRAGVAEMPNLQCSGHDAKPYQVRQVRDIKLKYSLGDDA
jgi:predicted RNA binding protein YcfA (HicA-like mRNA interferase family)